MSDMNLAFLFAAVYFAPTMPRGWASFVGLVYLVAGVYLGATR